jgi:hypothetical protein
MPIARCARFFHGFSVKAKEQSMTLAVFPDAETAATRGGATDTPAARRAAPTASWPDELHARYAGLDGIGLLRPLIECEFAGRLAVVSSFGAESGVLLALVAEIDRRTPCSSSIPENCSPRRCVIGTS